MGRLIPSEPCAHVALSSLKRAEAAFKMLLASSPCIVKGRVDSQVSGQKIRITNPTVRFFLKRALCPKGRKASLVTLLNHGCGLQRIIKPFYGHIWLYVLIRSWPIPNCVRAFLRQKERIFLPRRYRNESVSRPCALHIMHSWGCQISICEFFLIVPMCWRGLQPPSLPTLWAEVTGARSASLNYDAEDYERALIRAFAPLVRVPPRLPRRVFLCCLGLA